MWAGCTVVLTLKSLPFFLITQGPLSSMADSPYSLHNRGMRVDGLLLMNEGPKRKCIPASALKGSSCLFDDSTSDVCVSHTCRKIKHPMIECKREKVERRKPWMRSISTGRKRGPGGRRAEKSGGNAAAPPEVAPPVNRRPGQRRNWSRCQGERSERRANFCCDGLDFFISNMFHMSASDPCHWLSYIWFRAWEKNRTMYGW